MTDLWFERDFGEVSRRGSMLYASSTDGVWAVLRMPRTFPDDLEQESDELLSFYGAAAGGIGYLLMNVGVRLPMSLEQWSTAASIPAAELGGWAPSLVTIDGASRLALTRDFEGLRVITTTWSDEHVVLVVPSAEPTAALRHFDKLAASPPPH